MNSHSTSRTGFTLIEVMVSILIFSVMSIAMIGVFSAATSIFRAGESARAATDEATAVLAMIDDDLKRMVAPQDGGFFYTKAHMPNTGTPGGNMVMAFKIRNPDPSAVSETGVNARLIVLYWVDHDPAAAVDNWDLHRATARAADSDNVVNTTSEFDVVSALYTTAHATDSIVARGCLCFGVEVTTPTTKRQTLEWTNCEPIGPARYCTEANAANLAQPYPDAFRISLSITGGNRFGSKGTLISDTGTSMRVAGVKQVQITGDAFARIDTPESGKAEWVRYDSFAKGVMTYSGANGRGQRRTTEITHDRGVPVYFCPTFTLVRTLPR